MFLRLLTERPANPIQTVCYRKIKAINLNAVVKDIHDSLLVGDHSEQPLDKLVSIYQTELSALLNKHPPLKTRTFTIRPQAEWYTADIRQAKQLRRRAERLWRKTRLTIHRDIFMERRGDVNDLIRKTKTDYYTNLICDNKDNNEKLFNVVNTFLGRKQSMPLPRKPVDILLESFSEFFISKIVAIKASITTDGTGYYAAPQPSPLVRDPMDTLHPAKEQEIQCIIAASPNKHCALDPFPTGLVKSCKTILSPIIMEMINKSLSSGEFPQAFKNALVTPLLKKRTLDEEILNNYRPVSNQTFVSKIIEKVVASRLNHHLMYLPVDWREIEW